MFDFTPIDGCVGADLTVWNRLKAKADRLKIEIKPTNWIPNHEELTRGVVEHIPEGATTDWSSWSDSEAFDLNISTIPDEDIKGRPEQFRLEIVHPYVRTDLAYKFGIATQGTNSSYNYYKPAYYAIDNNDSTYNQTKEGIDGENWLQIELPHSTKVQKIVIQNQEKFSGRLKNAKVYLNSTPYTGEVNEDNLVGVLKGTNEEQNITFNPPRSVSYLLIKGEQREEGYRNLHLRKVEVYGEVSAVPTFVNSKAEFVIPNATNEGAKVGTAKAVDYQDDLLTYAIEDDVPFSVNSEGDIVVDGALDASSYTFNVEVSDGIHSTIKTVTIEVTPVDALEVAIETGKVDKVTLEELLDGSVNEIEAIKEYKDDLLHAIYEEHAIVYDPTKDSQVLEKVVNNDKAVALLRGENNILALGGEKNSTRYLIFGSTPYSFFENGENLSYKPFLNREFLWLVGGLPLNSNLMQEAKSIVYFSMENEVAFKSYMGDEFAQWSLKKCSDYSMLNSCIDGADLIVFEQENNLKSQEIQEALEFALKKHIPVAYFHPNWGDKKISDVVAKKFLFTFHHGGNWWAKDSVDSENYLSMIKNGDLEEIKTLLSHLKNRDYSFDWSKCKDNDGNYGTKYDNCSEVVGLESEFNSGADNVKVILGSLDEKKMDAFKRDDFRLAKLLALLGDKMRQNVKYPMDKVFTDDNVFLASLFTDYSVYNYREINPTQSDMGNFSRSDFSHISPITKIVNMVSKTPLRAAGAYLLPGETVKVTRLDNNASVASYVFVNTLRSAATHEYENGGYKRPKFLQSTYIPIAPNESIYMTSPYGGPLHLIKMAGM